MSIALRFSQDIASPADVNASTIAILASLTGVAQQVTDLAAAGLDDATTAQVNAARDAVLSALSVLSLLDVAVSSRATPADVTVISAANYDGSVG